MILPVVLTISGAAADTNRIAVAEFSRLVPGSQLPAEWKSVHIPGIPRHTTYEFVEVEGKTVLRAESDAAMSSLTRKLDVDPTVTPWLQWRWRISGLIDKSSVYTKHGDDYPVRMYVMFDYDIGQLPFFERTRIRLARALYGNQLPLAALCYVWGNAEPPGTSVWNAYTNRVRMVVATSGANRSNQWVELERNVKEDYRLAFGDPVPRITGLALATDTDNTGEKIVAWYGDISFADVPGTASRFADR